MPDGRVSPRARLLCQGCGLPRWFRCGSSRCVSSNPVKDNAVSGSSHRRPPTLSGYLSCKHPALALEGNLNHKGQMRSDCRQMSSLYNLTLGDYG